MSSRTRRKSAPFPLSPMKAALRPGSVGIGPGAPCACPCAGPRARARRVARIRPTTRRSLLITERLDRVEAGRNLAGGVVVVVLGDRELAALAEPDTSRGHTARGQDDEVGAEALDLLAHARLRPGADAHHGDHGAHADDDPQHRQEAPELVDPQRADGDPTALPDVLCPENLHFFILLLSGGHSSLDPRLPIPNNPFAPYQHPAERGE